MKFGQGTSSFDASSSSPLTPIDKLSMSQCSWSNLLNKGTIVIKNYRWCGTFYVRSLWSMLECHFRSCSDIWPDLVRCAIEDLTAPNTHLVSAINEPILKVCTTYQAVLAISGDMQSTFMRELYSCGEYCCKRARPYGIHGGSIAISLGTQLLRKRARLQPSIMAFPLTISLHSTLDRVIVKQRIPEVW